IEIFGVNFRDRQSVPPKMFREAQECDVLFTDVIDNANRAGLGIAQPNNVAAGTAELSLNGKHAFGSAVEMLLKKFLEDVHRRNLKSDDSCISNPKSELCKLHS